MDRAIAARGAGDYDTAIRTLGTVVAQNPDELRPRLLLAETLAWAKRFAESEREYRRAVDRDPTSRDATLGLARVLLWQGRYFAARPLFVRLMTANDRDLDAAEGAATAAYWSGDYRTAQRELAAILRRDPKRETVRQALDEIDAAARPLDRIDLDATNDDQPYRFVRAAASSSLFSDPLTRWDATAGSWWMHASRSGIRADAPFFRIGNETTFPAQRLVATVSVGAIRHPDGEIRPLGSAAISLRVSSRSTVAASVDQREMLATATAIDRHISSRSVAMQWRRQADHEWSASADLRQIQYSDRNRGWALAGYVLAPIATVAHVTISGGASAAIRDTRASRFYVESISSARAGNEFLYSYRGAYTPYWTPRRFREARAILAADWNVQHTHVRMQADGGITRDRATNFGPDSGTTALPANLYAFEFGREYHPLHLQMTISRNLPGGMSIEAAIDHNVTVFYKANGIRASLVRRR